MATMKLYELVNHYHIGTELTCAEAVFMACNEYYHLNLSEETRKMSLSWAWACRPSSPAAVLSLWRWGSLG